MPAPYAPINIYAVAKLASRGNIFESLSSYIQSTQVIGLNSKDAQSP